MKLKLLGISALVILLLASMQGANAAKPALKCSAAGLFKVVMFSDTQDDENMDPRTTALMEKILDIEKPNMVVIAGDCISGGDCDTAEQVRQAISHVAYPMEKRKIPWAIVFGNHDQEHAAKTKLGKADVIKIYASYPSNLNDQWNRKIHGVGNNNLLIRNAAGDRPVFCLWLIDSGDYAPQSIGGYDWIHPDQVDWYRQTSKGMELKYGRKIPGIAYFHIPLREFTEMAIGTKIEGDRNEPECPAAVNGGFFAAALDRGDIKGIFSGHDHINNYIGEWMGIKMGFDSSAGYASYNLPDNDPKVNRSRGGRVFLIQESDPWNFKTWMRYTDGSRN